MFAHTSRYYHLETISLTLANGRVVAYKQRRFLPQGEEMPLLTETIVTEGDRLDIITARLLGDPEQFWRICDANDAMDPAELTARIGRALRVSVPQV